MPDNAVSKVVGVLVVVGLVIALLNLMFSPALFNDGDPVQLDDAVSLESAGTGTWVNIAHAHAKSDEVVRDSRGYALQFHGTNDSYLTSDSGVHLGDDSTWTVSQPVLNVTDTDSTQTILAVGDPNLFIQYVNGTQDNFSAVYLTTQDSYRVNVSAPANPENTSFVFVTLNQSTLSIHRNSTAGESVDVSTANKINGNLTTATPFSGTLDETRVMDDVLSSAERTQHMSEPVAPSNANETGRIMYDVGEGTSVPIWWTASGATASNASWVSGFEGNVLDEKTGIADIIGGNDYRWRTDGPQIQAVENGRLDGAPVAFVEYTFIPNGPFFDVTGTMKAVLAILAIIPLMIGYSKLMEYWSF